MVLCIGNMKSGSREGEYYEVEVAGLRIVLCLYSRQGKTISLGIRGVGGVRICRSISTSKS